MALRIPSTIKRVAVKAQRGIDKTLGKTKPIKAVQAKVRQVATKQMEQKQARRVAKAKRQDATNRMLQANTQRNLTPELGQRRRTR